MNIKTLEYGLFAFACAAQITTQIADAQDTVYLSHLGSSADTIGIGIGSDSWWAVSFTTGQAISGYNLDTAQLRITSVSGNPSGFELLLCDDKGGHPNSNLKSFTGSTPTGAGIYSFAASGIALAPSTTYWILARSPDLTSSGNTIYWALDSNAVISNDGWSLDTSSMVTGAGSASDTDWSHIYWVHVIPGGLTLAINASPVPEPQVYALTGMGLFALVVRRRRESDTLV